MDRDSQEPNRQANRDSAVKSAPDRDGRDGPPSPATSSADRPSRGGGSLYETTLQERRSSRLLNLVWIVIAGSILAGFVTFFSSSAPDPQLLEQVPRPPRQTEGPSLTEQLLSEIRSGRRSMDSTVTGEARAEASADGSAATSPPRAADTDQSRSSTERPSAPGGQGQPGKEPTSRPAERAARQDEHSRTSQRVASAPVGTPVPGAGPTRSQTAARLTASPAAPAGSAPERADDTAATSAAAGPGSGEIQAEPTVSQTEAGPAPPGSAKLDAALRILQRQSSVASRLLTGDLVTLELREYRIVHETDGEVWVDLVARWRNADAEIHLIWAVDLQKESVRPLSSEARRLEEASGSS